MKKSSEQKIAQRFVVLAYKRLRNNRRYYNRARDGKWPSTTYYYLIMNESHNHLQLAKKIYYNL